MPNFMNDYGSYLRADDLKRADGTYAGGVLTISHMEREKVGDNETKWVLHFHGKEKGLPLNKTNAQVLCDLFGADSENVRGQQINLWVDPNVTYQGRVTPAIRLAQGSAPQPVGPVQTTTGIPQGGPPQTHVQNQQPPDQAAGPPNPYDDDIPF